MSFTIADYIKDMGLGVDPRDTAVTKKIAAHLRKLGYKPRRHRESDAEGKTKSQILWEKNDRELMLKELDRKLEALLKKEPKK